MLACGSIVREEEAFYDGAQDAGQLHGEREGGVVLVVLDGDDGLTADPASKCQVLLSKAGLLAERLDVVSHKAARRYEMPTESAMPAAMMTTAKATVASAPRRSALGSWKSSASFTIECLR